MLKDDFYFIENLQENDNQQWIHSIRWNFDHIIFSAHFPDQPIVPGACILEIVKELISEKTGRNWHVQQVNQLKFLNIIRPQEFLKVDVNIILKEMNDHFLEAKAVVSFDQVIFSKICLKLFS
ncbi:MAG: hypothetical protein PHR53_07765 [Bacteroidales bacterium]|nr:hypothetical protein [Bacteroidales bacterium]